MRPSRCPRAGDWTPTPVLTEHRAAHCQDSPRLWRPVGMGTHPGHASDDRRHFEPGLRGALPAGTGRQHQSAGGGVPRHRIRAPRRQAARHRDQGPCAAGRAACPARPRPGRAPAAPRPAARPRPAHLGGRAGPALHPGRRRGSATAGFPRWWPGTASPGWTAQLRQLRDAATPHARPLTVAAGPITAVDENGDSAAATSPQLLHRLRYLGAMGEVYARSVHVRPGAMPPRSKRSSPRTRVPAHEEDHPTQRPAHPRPARRLRNQRSGPRATPALGPRSRHSHHPAATRRALAQHRSDPPGRSTKRPTGAPQEPFRRRSRSGHSQGGGRPSLGTTARRTMLSNHGDLPPLLHPTHTCCPTCRIGDLAHPRVGYQRPATYLTALLITNGDAGLCIKNAMPELAHIGMSAHPERDADASESVKIHRLASWARLMRRSRACECWPDRRRRPA